MEKLVKHPNAQYVMPFLFVHDIFIPVLDELLKDETNPVKYVYGNVKSKWTGGRYTTCTLNNLDKIEKYLDKIVNKYNLIPAFTFTSQTMSKEILNDEFCNNLLDIAYKKGCHFIVASENLYKHITDRYKDAHMTASVIIPAIKIHEPFFNETKFYNEMLNKYEIVVLRPEYTIENIDKLNKLIKEPSRVEVLINQYCHWNCKSAKKHYKIIEDLTAGKITMEEYNNTLDIICPKEKENYKSVCMTNDIIERILQQGISKLKIQGRDYISYDYLFENEIYNFFFNNEVPIDKIRNKINLLFEKHNKNNQMK